mgnify:CR=1 FL=1
MALRIKHSNLIGFRLLSCILFLVVLIVTLTGCTVTRKVGETVEKTTKTVTDTTRTLTRKWRLSDEDLLRKVADLYRGMDACRVDIKQITSFSIQEM